MKTSRTLEAEAIDPKHGMTLDELAALVEEAKRCGIPGNARIVVRIRWGGYVKDVEVKG